MSILYSHASTQFLCQYNVMVFIFQHLSMYAYILLLQNHRLPSYHLILSLSKDSQTVHHLYVSKVYVFYVLIHSRRKLQRISFP